ncbi:RNA-directed DNA polymerase, eukaryota, reverse transcriptase zinc-binding domain protein [Tanacetum coccineum]
MDGWFSFLFADGRRYSLTYYRPAEHSEDGNTSGRFELSIVISTKKFFSLFNSYAKAVPGQQSSGHVWLCDPYRVFTIVDKSFYSFHIGIGTYRIIATSLHIWRPILKSNGGNSESNPLERKDAEGCLRRNVRGEEMICGLLEEGEIRMIRSWYCGNVTTDDNEDVTPLLHPEKELHHCASIYNPVGDGCGDGSGMQWEWRRPIRDGVEQIQLIRLVNLLQNYTPSIKHDRWNYLLDPSNDFSVSSMRSHIESVMLSSVHDPVRWNKCLPLKINIHVWRLLLDRLPTHHNLDVRGIDLDSTRCPMCDDNIETTQHLFVECKVAVEIWKMVSMWWDISDFPKDLQSLITWSDSVNLTYLEKTCFDVVIQTTTWILWRYRNRICFDEKPPSKDSLGAKIKFIPHLDIK